MKYCSLWYRRCAQHSLRDNLIQKIFEIRPAQGSALASIAVATLEDRDARKAATRIKSDQLLRQLATSMTSAKSDDWEIRHLSGSAPHLYQAGILSELNVSVAHSGHWVAVGLASNSDIGVDIQTHKENERHQAMAEFLGLETNAAADAQHFFSCWTLREAITKATCGSLLTPHAIESELTAACEAQGNVVNVGSFTAMVEMMPPDAHLAVVLQQSTEPKQCA